MNHQFPTTSGRTAVMQQDTFFCEPAARWARLFWWMKLSYCIRSCCRTIQPFFSLKSFTLNHIFPPDISHYTPEQHNCVRLLCSVIAQLVCDKLIFFATLMLLSVLFFFFYFGGRSTVCHAAVWDCMWAPCISDGTVSWIPDFFITNFLDMLLLSLFFY